MTSPREGEVEEPADEVERSRAAGGPALRLFVLQEQALDQLLDAQRCRLPRHAQGEGVVGRGGLLPFLDRVQVGVEEPFPGGKKVELDENGGCRGALVRLGVLG